MDLPTLLTSFEVFAFIFMPGCGFVLIPPTFKSYLKWRKTENMRDFCSMVIQGALSLCFLISIFPLFAYRVIEFHSLSGAWFYSLLAYLGLGVFMGYLTLPKMLFHYQKLMSKKTTTHFGLMVFFGFLSFYGLSSFFILMIHSVLSVTR